MKNPVSLVSFVVSFGDNIFILHTLFLKEDKRFIGILFTWISSYVENLNISLHKKLEEKNDYNFFK